MFPQIIDTCSIVMIENWCIFETSVTDYMSELQLNIIKWRNDGLYDTGPTEKLLQWNEK